MKLLLFVLSSLVSSIAWAEAPFYEIGSRTGRTAEGEWIRYDIEWQQNGMVALDFLNYDEPDIIAPGLPSIINPIGGSTADDSSPGGGTGGDGPGSTPGFDHELVDHIVQENRQRMVQQSSNLMRVIRHNRMVRRIAHTFSGCRQRVTNYRTQATDALRSGRRHTYQSLLARMYMERLALARLDHQLRYQNTDTPYRGPHEILQSIERDISELEALGARQPINRAYAQAKARGMVYAQPVCCLRMDCQRTQAQLAKTEAQILQQTPDNVTLPYVIDLSQIPDPVNLNYSFQTTQPMIRPILERIYKDLYKISPNGEKRIHARELGIYAIAASDQAFASSQPGEGAFYQSVASSLLDIAVGIDPVSGLGRSTYELFYGRNLITGEELGPWERGFAFLGVVTAGGSSTITRGSQAVMRLAQGLPHIRQVEQAIESGSRIASNFTRVLSHELRNAPGVVQASRQLESHHTLLRGAEANAGFIPREIADRMVGQRFENFDQFRRRFWQEMAESRYAQEFTSMNANNLNLMRGGNAPISHVSQHVGATSSYALHHIENIQHGGEVYDLGNLVIATPRFHSRVFHFASQNQATRSTP